MDPGDLLLWTAILTAVGSIAFSCLSLYARVPQYKRLSRILLLFSFVLTSATFILMVYYFQTSNFTIDYVVRHSKADYDGFYKLAGVWSGGKGSLLLWTWIISLSLVIQEALQWRRRERSGGSDDLEVYDWTRLFASIVLVAMLYLVLALGLFQKTDPMLLASAAGRTGMGLNPLLETPMVIVHPPMEFAGYALTTIPFAAALAFLVTEDPRWTDASLQWARMAWLFYTLAILLGGIWAYTVLGWGGYWAWDPVETSNLIPWIALTALLHAQLYHRQRRKFIWLAPLLAILAFVTTVFATFETRTGYVDSIHTFTSVGAGGAVPATEKLLLVMAQEPSAPPLMVLILAPLLAGGLLFVWRFAQIRKAEAGGGTPAHLWFPYAYVPFLAALLLWVLLDVGGFLSSVFDIGKMLGGGNAELGTVLLAVLVAGLPVAWMLLTAPEETPSAHRKDLVNDDSTMTVAVSLFSLWFFVTLMLMLVGVNSLDPAVFESRLPLLVLPLGLTLIAALTWRELGTERVLILVAVLVVLTVLLYALLEPRQFWLYVPIASVALVVALYRIAKSLDSRRTPGELRVAGLMLFGSGILGMLMWGSFPSQVNLGFASVDVSLPMTVLGFVASVTVLAGAAFAIRAKNLKVSGAVAALGILTIGYYAGAAMAAIALALIFRTVTKEERVEQRPLIQSRAAIRAASAHVVHLGVALVLLAYAASTFLPAESQVDSSLGTVSSERLGYSFRLTGASGEDRNGDGQYERVVAHVDILQNGERVGDGDLVFWWMAPSDGRTPHYMAGVDVAVLPLTDIYLTPIAFYSPEDGWTQTMGDTGRMASSTNVTRVTFELRVNPLVGVLWGGAWIMAGGIVLRTATEHRRSRARVGPIAPGRPEAPAMERSYEYRLEEELRSLGDEL